MVFRSGEESFDPSPLIVRGEYFEQERDTEGALAVVDRLEFARGVWGACLLVAPRTVAGRLLQRTVTPRYIMVVRILGVRLCVQALLTMPPRPSGLRPLGGAVDIMHVLSMLGIAIFAPRHRRAVLASAALASAAISGSFALLELWARRP